MSSFRVTKDGSSSRAASAEKTEEQRATATATATTTGRTAPSHQGSQQEQQRRKVSTTSNQARAVPEPLEGVLNRERRAERKGATEPSSQEQQGLPRRGSSKQGSGWQTVSSSLNLRQFSSASVDSLVSAINVKTFFRRPVDRGVGCGNKPLSRSNWKWRAKEQRHTEANTGRGSLLTRIRVTILQDSKLMAIDSAIGVAMEAAMIILFAVMIDNLSPDKEITFTRFDPDTRYFVGRIVLSILFLLHWMVHLFVYKTTQAGSVLTFINLVTAVWQLVVAFIALGYDDMEIGRTYVPMFLRVWPAREHLLALLSLMRHMLPGGDLFFQFLRYTTRMMTVMVTSFGLFQVIETLTENFITMTDSFYFITVTFTTVGYGEISPSHRYGKFLIMAIIFVATGFVPVILSKLQFIAEIYSQRRRYVMNRKHIIIAGYPSYKEAVLLLNEMAKLSTRRRAIVFVSKDPFGPRIFRLESLPEYAGKVFFIEGDIISKDVLDRARADDADAIFLMCPRGTVGSRGDYEVFRNSVGVNFLKPTLPQYLWTKHGAHNSLLKNVFLTVHRDLLKTTIMGIAMNYPGVIPWFVNLLHTSDARIFSFVSSKGKRVKVEVVLSKPMDEKSMVDEWQELYHLSRQQIPRLMLVPKALDGILFEKAVVMLHKRFGLLPLAVGDKDTREIKINCGGKKLRSNQDLLMVLADGTAIVDQALEVLTAEYDMRDGRSRHNVVLEEIELSSVYNLPHIIPRTLFYSKWELVQGGADLDATWQKRKSHDSSLPPRQKTHTFDNEPFAPGFSFSIERPRVKGHSYIFVDESTTQFADMLSSAEEEVETLAHRHENLCLLAHLARNAADPESIATYPIKLLSRTEPRGEAAEFVEFINGSGLRGYYLDKANIKDSKSILLFCSTEGRKEYGDAPLIAANQRLKSYLDEELLGVTNHISVNEVRCVIGPEGEADIPILPSHAKLARSDAKQLEEYDNRQMSIRRPSVLMELSSFRSCHNAHPKHVDANLFKHSEKDFQSTASFMSGCVLSTDMFQTLLIHAFHNPVLHNFVQTLFYGRTARQNTAKKNRKSKADGEARYEQPEEQQEEVSQEEAAVRVSFASQNRPLGDTKRQKSSERGEFGNRSGENSDTSEESIVLGESLENDLNIVAQQLGGHLARTDTDLLDPDFVQAPRITQHVFKNAARKVYPVPHRFGSFHNRENTFKTFGDALEALLVQYNVVCIGVWRVIPEGCSTIDGSRYMITNPSSAFDLWVSDEIYFLR